MLPALTACGETDYAQYVSEARSDLFCAQTEEFSVTVACVAREYPYLADGVPSTKTTLVEITLKDERNVDGYRVFLCGEKEIGGELSYRNVRDDYFFSQSVEVLPEKSVSLRVEWGEEKRELTATSVKNENTLSVDGALKKAISAEQEYIAALTDESGFHGEFYVRLLRREKNYYYVGVIDQAGNTLSLLLDGESGEVLARRTSP